jgi:uncharacterized membrane protein YeaQ/YmgE (transglycosylase-associated protein family)
MTQEEVSFNKYIDCENKCWGLSVIGLSFGAITGLLVLTKLDLMFAILSGVVGFWLGAYLSRAWHKGMVQRWAYWNLPLTLLGKSKHLPASHKRSFM